MESNFIQEYINYASKITDAPIDFHNFIGYGVLSSCIGNKVYIRLGDKHLYPNLWIILLAPSSFFRKSTAITIGVNIIKDYNTHLILPNEFSQEKLMEILEIQPQGTFVFYEFLSFLGLLSRDYMQGAKAFLTDLYDTPSNYIRKTKLREINIKKPCINIISATTLDWFMEGLKRGDLMGGFLPRFLFVPARNKLKSIYLPPPADENVKAMLVNELRNLTRSELTGEMTFSDEARKLYEEWCMKYESNIQQNNKYNELLLGFLIRLEIYFLKFAMLENINRFHSLTIRPETIKTITQVINWLVNQTTNLVSEEITFTKFQKDRKKIIKMITPEGITRRELIRSTHLSLKELNPVLETLLQEEAIYIDFIKTSGKSTILYKIKKPV